MQNVKDVGVNGEIHSNEEIIKGLKLLLYKETEKNHKLREMFKEQFGIEFDEQKAEEDNRSDNIS